MGWSGNEAIINALQHTLFWIIWWENKYKFYIFTFPKEEVKE